jgi:hypothetical protein
MGRSRRATMPFLDRFWSKVLVLTEDECWPWLGGRMVGNYGSFKLQLSSEKGQPWRSRSIPAHVVAYETTTGKQRPNGWDIDHTCGNPICQNPKHMVARTKSEHGRLSALKRWKKEVR